jgi:Ca2+/Na+ antiporter
MKIIVYTVLIIKCYFYTGHGGMGISNSLGSNTFDILLCLGLPWLIKSSMLALAPDPVQGQVYPHINMEKIYRAVMINSHGLEYSAISLLSSTLLLFVTFACYHFRLNRKVGIACLILYATFLALAATLELNVFFVVNLPICGRWYVYHNEDLQVWKRK